MPERGFASDRRDVLIEIGIGIEIGSIGETFHNDPDPDPDPDFDFDLDRAPSCCGTKLDGARRARSVWVPGCVRIPKGGGNGCSGALGTLADR